MKNESEICSVVSNSLRPNGLYSPWNSSGQNTEVGRFSLLQGIFPTQGLNAGLLHCRWTLYQLSHKHPNQLLCCESRSVVSTLCDPMDYSLPGSSVHGVLQARILEWVAIPFSRGPRNRTGDSCTAGGFFTNWATREVSLPINSFSLKLCKHGLMFPIKNPECHTHQNSSFLPKMDPVFPKRCIEH